MKIVCINRKIWLRTIQNLEHFNNLLPKKKVEFEKLLNNFKKNLVRVGEILTKEYFS